MLMMMMMIMIKLIIEKNKYFEIVVSLKHLSNFWRNLDMTLITCEITIVLTWSGNSVLNNIITYAAVATQGGNPEKPVTRAPTKATLKITDTKLYVPIVTLSTEDDNKLLEKLKADFKRAIKWNIYRSEMTNPVRTNNLTYLIDAAFNNVN